MATIDDENSPIKQTTALLSRSSKDQRGCYLAVPTAAGIFFYNKLHLYISKLFYMPFCVTAINEKKNL